MRSETRSMKNRLLPLLSALVALSGYAGEPASSSIHTPETSKLFRKYVEPASGWTCRPARLVDQLPQRARGLRLYCRAVCSATVKGTP